MNIQTIESTVSISKERLDELEECFWSETNDEWTQEWRDELSPAESAIVDEWDGDYEKATRKLVEAIVAAQERNKRPI